MILTLEIPGPANISPTNVIEALDRIATAVHEETGRDIRTASITTGKRKLTLPNYSTQAGHFTVRGSKLERLDG